MMRLDPPAVGRPATLARNGMVATPHYLASNAGLAALERGGSAVDALIAANAVLCVAYPHMAGLGGDCFALVWDHDSQTSYALSGSGRSDARATAEFYLDRGMAAIPARGPLAANTVPGAVDAWWELHQRFGRLPWGDLFARAIDYAERGVSVSTSLADWIAKDHQVLTEHAAAGRIFLHNGHPLPDRRRADSGKSGADAQNDCSGRPRCFLSAEHRTGDRVLTAGGQRFAGAGGLRRPPLDVGAADFSRLPGAGR